MYNSVYVYCHKKNKVIAICDDLDMASAVATAYYEKTQNHHTVGTAEYFKGAYPDIVLEPDKAVITIASGCAEVIDKPDALHIEIHDYDVEGEWVKENPNCFTDSEGDDYQVLSFPATRIKFSANGDQAFTDVEMKFRNYYRCPDCENEWDDIWDSTCDDKCGECGCSCSPVSSVDI